MVPVLKEPMSILSTFTLTSLFITLFQVISVDKLSTISLTSCLFKQ